MGGTAGVEGAELVRENILGSPFTAPPAAEHVAPAAPKRRPGRPRKATPPPAPPAEPTSAAEALIAEQAPPPVQPRAASKDDKAIEAVGQQLAHRGRQAGEHLSKAAPLAGTVLATKAEDGAAALARVVGRFFPGLLKAGGGGMIVFDVVTVVTALTALGAAALVDAGRLAPDHPVAVRLGVTELAAQLVAKQQAMAQQLAQAAAGVPQQMQPLDAQQFAYLQQQMLYQQQMQAQAQQQMQAQAAQAYAQQRAQAQAAQAYNAGAGLYPAFGVGG